MWDIYHLVEEDMDKRASRSEGILPPIKSSLVHQVVQGFRVKEGLSCVLFRVVAAGKSRNLDLPWLENPVHYFLLT